jgi:hypothetical protein
VGVQLERRAESSRLAAAGFLRDRSETHRRLVPRSRLALSSRKSCSCSCSCSYSYSYSKAPAREVARLIPRFLGPSHLESIREAASRAERFRGSSRSRSRSTGG